MTREMLQERNRRWMQQRQAELDRRQAQESVAAASTAASGPRDPSTRARSDPDDAAGSSGVGPSTNDVAVLDRLTEQITERLQVEVRRENARLMQDGAIGAQVECSSPWSPIIRTSPWPSKHTSRPARTSLSQRACIMQVESLLERHIGSNTCPICFELMSGKARSNPCPHPDSHPHARTHPPRSQFLPSPSRRHGNRCCCFHEGTPSAPSASAPTWTR